MLTDTQRHTHMPSFGVTYISSPRLPLSFMNRLQIAVAHLRGKTSDLVCEGWYLLNLSHARPFIYFFIYLFIYSSIKTTIPDETF